MSVESAGRASGCGVGVAGCPAEFAEDGTGLVPDATVESPQPAAQMASAAINGNSECFVFMFFVLWQPGPNLLPKPAAGRQQNNITHGIPPALEPAAPGANSRSTHHAVARACANVIENRAN